MARTSGRDKGLSWGPALATLERCYHTACPPLLITQASSPAVRHVGLPEGVGWVPGSPHAELPVGAACVILEGELDEGGGGRPAAQHAPSLLLWSPDLFESVVDGAGAAELRPSEMVAGPKGAQVVVG